MSAWSSAYLQGWCELPTGNIRLVAGQVLATALRSALGTSRSTQRRVEPVLEPGILPLQLFDR